MPNMSSHDAVMIYFPLLHCQSKGHLGCKWARALIGEGAGQLVNGKALMCVSISTSMV